MPTFLNDLKNAAETLTASAPAARTSTVTGSSQDMIAGDGQVAAIQTVGAVSGTSPTLDGKIQESSDGSTWTDVSGATFTQVTASTSLQVITFQRSKQYLRYVGTIAGTSPSFTMAVTFIHQKKKF